jgi:hypothetical protein|eukprot:105361-Prymnesium_polylepis.1
MDGDDKQQFKQAIKNLVETHQMLKEHNAQGKEIRDKHKALKAVVLGFMEATSLDVCNVSHNGKNGEISVRTSKRMKTLKKEDAISQIEKYLSDQTDVEQTDEKANTLWTAIQSTRVVTEHKDVSVKKL